MHWLPVVWFFFSLLVNVPHIVSSSKGISLFIQIRNKFFLQIARDWLSFISSQNEVNALWFSWFVFLGWQFPDRNSTLHPQKCYLFRYAYDRTVLFKEAFSVDRNTFKDVIFSRHFSCGLFKGFWGRIFLKFSRFSMCLQK